jgi:hypothetical protein
MALVAALISVFGPAFLAWVRKLLNKTAKSLPAPESYPTPHAATAALFDAAIEAVPARKFGRRILLRVLRRVAVARAPELFEAARAGGGAVPPLTELEAAELADAAGAGK